MSRMPILQDDLVLVTLPGEEQRKPIAFANVLNARAGDAGGRRHGAHRRRAGRRAT